MTDDEDDDGYPTEEELTTISKWSYKDLPGLFEYIHDLWNWPDMMTEKDHRWTLITGGWSGNEDLVGALMENHSAWSLCWQASYRGGKHEFEIPENFRNLTP